MCRAAGCCHPKDTARLSFEQWDPPSGIPAVRADAKGREDEMKGGSRNRGDTGPNGRAQLPGTPAGDASLVPRGGARPAAREKSSENAGAWILSVGGEWKRC